MSSRFTEANQAFISAYIELKAAAEAHIGAILREEAPEKRIRRASDLYAMHKNNQSPTMHARAIDAIVADVAWEYLRNLTVYGSDCLGK